MPSGVELTRAGSIDWNYKGNPVIGAKLRKVCEKEGGVLEGTVTRYARSTVRGHTAEPVTFYVEYAQGSTEIMDKETYTACAQLHNTMSKRERVAKRKRI